MKNLLKSTVTAICASVAEQHEPFEHSAFRAPYTDVSEFVWLQLCQMTGYLKIPMIILTLVFSFFGIFRGFRVFPKLSATQRKSQLESWKNSPLSPLRDFVRFYESLILLALYSRLNQDTAR
jgi:hypothetical protein